MRGLRQYLHLAERVRLCYSENKKEEIEKKENNFFILYFFRPLSFYLTPLFLQVKATPNQVTWSGFSIGILACLAFIRGTPFFFQLGAWFYILYIFSDHIDGNIARFHGTTSHYGKFLDGVVTMMVESLFWLCFGLGVYRYSLVNHPSFLSLFDEEPSMLLLAGGMATASFLGTHYLKVRYGLALTSIEKMAPPTERDRDSGREREGSGNGHSPKKRFFHSTRNFSKTVERILHFIQIPFLFLAVYVPDLLPLYLFLFTAYSVLNCMVACAVLLYTAQRHLAFFRPY